MLIKLQHQLTSLFSGRTTQAISLREGYSGRELTSRGKEGCWDGGGIQGGPVGNVGTSRRGQRGQGLGEKRAKSLKRMSSKAYT